MSQRPTLLFVSTRFLFPVDSGGKIRTTQVLRGLMGGKYRIVLMSPATPALVERFSAELDNVCDEFRWWPEPKRSRWFHYARLRYLVSDLPIPVRTDRQADGVALVNAALADGVDVAVFDFAHAAVLAPPDIPCPSVMFTHNVEAEIFRRHLAVAGNIVARTLWNNQYEKMCRFEKSGLRRFDVVVAVADRDVQQFKDDYGVTESHVIPTGVDLEFFSFNEPTRDNDIVFCGSMDWLANQEGVKWFMDEIWARIARKRNDARMTVVGRAPPDSLVAEARRRGLNWRFTGFVDDVREHLHGAAVSVIPLRVGGGTRLKAYEAMAMGNVIVSTAVGMEGLPVEAGEHYLRADDPDDFADAVLDTMRDRASRMAMASAARSFVQDNFSYVAAAKSFEQACDKAIAIWQGVNNAR